MNGKKGLFRLFSLCLAAVMVFLCLPVSASAKAINPSTEITHTRDFLVQNPVTPQNWEETVMLASVGYFTFAEVEPFIPEKNLASAYETSTRILTLMVLGEMDRESAAESEEFSALQNLQQQDGSFGDFDSTVYSVITLNACDAVFASERAVENILSYQQEDGSFLFGGENPIFTTAKAMTVLSEYLSDEKVTAAMEKAVLYIESAKTEAGLIGDGRCDTFCAAVIGLVDVGVQVTDDKWGYLVNNLAEFKNKDYSYTMYADDEDYDPIATAYALAAFDAMGRSKSVYVRLMEEGTLSVNIWESFKPFITGYEILAVISVAFWVWIIFFRNRKSKKEVVIND